MSAALKRPPSRMTVAEFLAWDSGDRSGSRWHLVDGEPKAMAPASLVHGALQSELGRLVGNHLLAIGSAFAGITEPGIVPRIRSSENFRIPDFGVTCSSHRAGLEMAEPVLLAEILSPNNVAETREALWAYATMPSVMEILVLHSTRIEAELLRRTGGFWPPNPAIIGADEVLSLDSIGFSAPLVALYRTSGLV